LIDSRRQIVIAADRPPGDLESLEERVRSRLSGGLCIEIGGLDEALRIKILEARIAAAKLVHQTFEVPAAVVAYVASVIRTNGRDLDGAVNRLLVYIMTGNYGVEDAHGNTERLAPGDLAESLVKLHYTPPAARGAPGQLAAVAWFTPFEDADRNRNGEDNFQDYDLGSGGPVPLPGLQLVVAAGKDGVLYVLGSELINPSSLRIR
jgi:Bacterial dnaA  protein